MSGLKHSKLDLWHKGLYPLLAVAVAAFVAYVAWSNNDKQNQLDKLQAEMQRIQEQQKTAEKKQSELVTLAEEQAQFMRVAVCRRMNRFLNFSNSPEEEKAAQWIKSNYCLLQVTMMHRDYELLGEAKTKELWAKAQKDAETLKIETIRW